MTRSTPPQAKPKASQRPAEVAPPTELVPRQAPESAMKISTQFVTAWLGLFALVAAAPAAAYDDEFLELVLEPGEAIETYDEPYYEDSPYVVVSSSDGERYDTRETSTLRLGLDPDYRYRTAATGFNEVFKNLRIEGFGSTSMSMIGTLHTYEFDYLPPSGWSSPVDLCNNALDQRGQSAITDGFVLEKADTYEVAGEIRYFRGGFHLTLNDTVFAPVHIVCKGVGKRTDGPPHLPGADTESLGFVMTLAEVVVPPAYQEMETTSCPVTVPVRFEFEGTEPKTFKYRVRSAEGGVSPLTTGRLRAHSDGNRRSHSVQIPVPEPAGPPPEPGGSDAMLPGIGPPPPPPTSAATGMASVGGGGGGHGPLGGADVEAMPASPGVYADSFRIEVVEPHALVSSYEGYLVRCKTATPEPIPAVMMMEPDPQLPPPPAQLRVRKPTLPTIPAVGLEPRTPAAPPSARNLFPQKPAPTGDSATPRKKKRRSKKKSKKQRDAARLAVPQKGDTR